MIVCSQPLGKQARVACQKQYAADDFSGAEDFFFLDVVCPDLKHNTVKFHRQLLGNILGGNLGKSLRKIGKLQPYYLVELNILASQNIVADVNDLVVGIDGNVAHSALCDEKVDDRIVHEVIGVQNAVLPVHMGLENVAEYRLHSVVIAHSRNDYHAWKNYSHAVGLCYLRANRDANIILERINIVLAAVDPVFLTGFKRERNGVRAHSGAGKIGAEAKVFRSEFIFKSAASSYRKHIQMVIDKNYCRSEIIEHLGFRIVKIRITHIELHNNICENIAVELAREDGRRCVNSEFC